MSYYISIDKTGFVTGCYCDDLHKNKVDFSNLIKITKKDWEEWKLNKFKIGFTKTGKTKKINYTGESLPDKDLMRMEFGSIQDQLDMIYEDLKNGTSKWANHRDAIKKKFNNGE